MKFKQLPIVISCCAFFIFLLQQHTYAQQIIKGTVISDKNSQPVPRASITIKGISNTTTTDQQGHFMIAVPHLPAVMIIKYNGLQPQETRLAADSVANRIIILHDPAHALDEVVVTAGRSKQLLKDVPQKIELVSSKDIAYTPALDVTDIIKKTTAVDVIQYPGILSGVGFRGFRPQFSGLTQHTLLL